MENGGTARCKQGSFRKGPAPKVFVGSLEAGFGMHRPLACDEARPAQGLCGGRLRHASGSPSAITFHDAAMPAWLFDPPLRPAWVEHRASTSLPAWKRYILDKGPPAQIHHPLLRRSPHHVRALIDSDPANRYVLAGGKPCNMYKAVFSVDRPHVMHRPLARDEGQRLRASEQ